MLGRPVRLAAPCPDPVAQRMKARPRTRDSCRGDDRRHREPDASRSASAASSRPSRMAISSALHHSLYSFIVSKTRTPPSSSTGLHVLMNAYFSRVSSGRLCAASKSACHSFVSDSVTLRASSSLAPINALRFALPPSGQGTTSCALVRLLRCSDKPARFVLHPRSADRLPVPRQAGDALGCHLSGPGPGLGAAHARGGGRTAWGRMRGPCVTSSGSV